jgi:hypothetical protein
MEEARLRVINQDGVNFGLCVVAGPLLFGVNWKDEMPEELDSD